MSWSLTWLKFLLSIEGVLLGPMSLPVLALSLSASGTDLYFVYFWHNCAVDMYFNDYNTLYLN